MPHTITGACHCNNLSFELTSSIAPEDIRARACDCRFCRIHGARNWSDPKGSAIIRIADPGQLQKYRFALRTADFYVCRVCGAYLGAVLTEKRQCVSTVNLRLTKSNAEDEPASYGAEDITGRVDRRLKVWTPTVVIMTK